MFGGDGERQALAFAEALRLALQRQGEDRPVAGAAQVDLADLAEEDEPLDRGREAVRAGGDGRADESDSGRIERVTGVPGGIGVRRPTVADEPAERRPDDQLAPGSVASTCPWSRFVGPSNRATNASAGRL